MKKIGFIDLFIDEWHANNYPKMIRESRFKGEFDVAYAWEENPKKDARPLDAWCKEFNVAPASSIEEVVEKCDRIIVLAPSNPEAHERLAELPLKSGKPVYIDKPFAPSVKAAKRIIKMAEDFKTPMFSSSALRFGSSLGSMVAELGGSDAAFASIRGGGRLFDEYSIHQIEMLIMLMGSKPVRLMQCGANGVEVLVVEFASGARGVVNFANNYGSSADCVAKDGKLLSSGPMGDFFPRFIDAMLEFFATGKAPVPASQTLAVAATLETAIAAKAHKDVWHPICMN